MEVEFEMEVGHAALCINELVGIRLAYCLLEVAEKFTR
jgi:hypothetical protein